MWRPCTSSHLPSLGRASNHSNPHKSTTKGTIKMAQLQAEKWEDLKPDVARLNKALEDFHTPPEPDDHYSQSMHKIKSGVEALTHHVNTRSEQQEEVELFNAGS